MSTLHNKTCEVGPKLYSEEKLQFQMLIRKNAHMKGDEQNNSRGQKKNNKVSALKFERKHGQIFFKGKYFYFLKIYLFLFIFGCIGSSLLRTDFLQQRRAGGTLRLAVHRLLMWWLLLLWSTGSRHVGFSSCGMQAQQLWHTGLVTPRHVGSSQTTGRTPIPCIGRQILNHCTTREVLMDGF